MVEAGSLRSMYCPIDRAAGAERMTLWQKTELIAVVPGPSREEA